MVCCHPGSSCVCGMTNTRTLRVCDASAAPAHLRRLSTQAAAPQRLTRMFSRAWTSERPLAAERAMESPHYTYSCTRAVTADTLTAAERSCSSRTRLHARVRPSRVRLKVVPTVARSCIVAAVARGGRRVVPRMNTSRTALRLYMYGRSTIVDS